MTLSTASTDLSGLDVLAAGAVLWRPTPDGPEVALVHRNRYGDWSFPKGKLDRGESLPFAATREVREETGIDSRLGPVLGDMRYRVPEGHKLVRYWAAQARDGAFVPNDETDELRWLSPDAAATLLTYPHDRVLLHRFTELAPPHSVVLLVRHAKAGSRSNWPGEDEVRPLSNNGRRQASQLTDMLPLFGPDRIFTASPLRCWQTVEGAAQRLGLPIGEEPVFGEIEYRDKPAATLERMRELARAPGVTVISSQGGVIPDLLGALGVGDGGVSAQKGSTWVLGFDGEERVRSADYLPDPSGH